MPMIDLTMPEGAISDQKLPRLMDELSTTLIAWEGAPDNERTRSVTWGFVHQLRWDQVFAGGATPGLPLYRVQVTVPDKTLLRSNNERKTGLIRAVTERVLSAEGSSCDGDNLGRVWCLIHEVPDGNWGAFAGQFTMREILKYIGHTPVAPDEVPSVPLPEPR